MLRAKSWSLLLLLATCGQAPPKSPGPQAHEYAVVDEVGSFDRLPCQSEIQVHVPVFCEQIGKGYHRRGIYIPLSRAELLEKKRVTVVGSTPLTLTSVRKVSAGKAPAEWESAHAWLVNIAAITEYASGNRNLFLTSWPCLDLGILDGLGAAETVQAIGRSPAALGYLGLQSPLKETRGREVVLDRKDGPVVTLSFLLGDAGTECGRVYGVLE